ncbi:OsmC family protein [Wenxinia saemankumensis]|uniref:Osmotically inducible protein OsmC n=1 Tax=Wenxinia saemankumensis TaxID=1447782 RepID=A0A1M6AMQ5_9RHOB|nr:OsmC family protein [Wenxinia saemankumensis]SHI37493.1 osmotically inducible protein OsmC [Wenxinia saemankumensis]
MAIEKFGSAHWSGGIKTGGGHVTTQTKSILQHPYGFNARFEGGPGTNPEELVGTAHAACFAMALSGNLEGEDLKADSIDAKSTITLEKDGDGFTVTKAHVEVEAKVPGASEEQFQKIAKTTEETCPISKLLNCEITMDAKLVG